MVLLYGLALLGVGTSVVAITADAVITASRRTWR